MINMTRYEMKRGADLYRATAADARDHAMRIEYDTLPDMGISDKPQPCAWVDSCILLAIMIGAAIGILFASAQGWIA